MDIRSNFVPDKSLKFNYKQPPWLNPKIFSLRKLAKLNHFTKPIRLIESTAYG